MPCTVFETPEERRDWERDALEQIQDLEARLAEREAQLCGVFTLLENGFTSHYITFYLRAILEQVNWSETGTTLHATETWWEDHKEKDQARKEQEAWELARKKRDILNKLTEEEREILGL